MRRCRDAPHCLERRRDHPCKARRPRVIMPASMSSSAASSVPASPMNRSAQRDLSRARALYISHIGMTEPLGQSQVLPYLVGLAKRGAQIEILSFEAEGTKPEAVEALAARLARAGIE